jgi:hypothetical protein
VTPIAGQENGGVLILLLSSNADDIANSLNALAQSEAITQTLANVVGHDRLAASADAAAGAEGKTKAGDALTKLGDTLVADKTLESADAGRIRANFLAYANALAAAIAPGTHFESLAEAKLWVRTQPSGTGASR